MTKEVFIDTETAGQSDLATVGPELYAQHPTTRVLLIGWAVDDEEPQAAPPAEALEVLGPAVQSADRIWMHNVSFDYAVWRHLLVAQHGFPALDAEKLYDSSAACRRAGLPAGLDAAAEALGLAERKDAEGTKLMKQLSRPMRAKDSTKISWEHITPAALERLVAYCRQDIEVMRRLVRALPAWAVETTEAERWAERWTLEANRLGVATDEELRDEMEEALQRAEAQLPAELRSPAKVKALLANLGVNIADATEEVMEELLKDPREEVRKIAQLRLLVSRAAVRKLFALVNRTGLDGRLRNILRYHGAHTGRWAGEGVQLQNLPRDATGSDKEVAEERAKLTSDDPAVITAAASKLLRPLFIAQPGHVLIRADFSQIEARLLLFLACSRMPDTESARLVQEFLQADAYRLFASKIFQKPAEEISKAERQIGKAAVLGLGYGMGAERFKRTVKSMCGQDLELEEAQRIVQLYRQVYKPIPALWRACGNAAARAIQEAPVCRELGFRLPNKADAFFAYSGDWLVLCLPSGRYLAYHQAKHEEDGIVVPHGPRGPMRLYGGLLVENLIQAVARDVLVEAMRRIESKGWRVVFTVHDEIVVEAPEARVQECAADVTACMTEAPSWLYSPDLPWIGQVPLFGVELAFGRHYGK